MELGATVCTARRPSCATCPLRARCRALAAGRVAELPTPASRRAPLAVHAVALAARSAADETWLVARRPAAGALAGLWEFPQTVLAHGGEAPLDAAARLALALGLAPLRLHPCEPVRHAFTHRRLTVAPVVAETAGAPAVDDRGRPAADAAVAGATYDAWLWAPHGELLALPASRLMEKLWARVAAATTDSPRD